jgi:hypothetical protein
VKESEDIYILSCKILNDAGDSNRQLEWRITFLRGRSRRKAPFLTSSKKTAGTAAKCRSFDFVGEVAIDFCRWSSWRTDTSAPQSTRREGAATH